MVENVILVSLLSSVAKSRKEKQAIWLKKKQAKQSNLPQQEDPCGLRKKNYLLKHKLAWTQIEALNLLNKEYIIINHFSLVCEKRTRECIYPCLGASKRVEKRNRQQWLIMMLCRVPFEQQVGGLDSFD